MAKIKYVWLIAYINPDYIYRVNKDLSRFDNIRAYIPTVKVLKKKLKKKKYWEHIPLLFNYGFFKVPEYQANNEILMEKVKERVACISGWVKDITQTTEPKGNKAEKKDHSPIARSSKQDIINLKELQKTISIYDKSAIDSLCIGDVLTLKGYPFDGLEAEVLSINKDKKTVTVSLKESASLLKEVEVDFDNILYTIYKGNFDDSLMNHFSLDEYYNSRKISKILRIYE